MKIQNILIAHPSSAKEMDIIKAFFEALKIKFEISKKPETSYNPEFVSMIKKGQKEIAEGKGIKMSVEEFKNLCK